MTDEKSIIVKTKESVVETGLVLLGSWVIEWVASGTIRQGCG